MSNLKTNDKQILEKLFQMESGYVLNFSDRTIGEFFIDNLDIDIFSEKYNYASGSKANRMRGFWAESDDSLVARSIIELIEYIENQILLEKFNQEEFDKALIERAKQIASSLSGSLEQGSDHKGEMTEDEFISKDFQEISVDELEFDSVITKVLKQRIEEIQGCLKAKASLAVVFLCGSTLEGILLGVASKFPKEFNQSKCAPNKDNKVLPFYDWTLSSFIDVGRDVGILGEDVKKFSHSLRDFRNYIHPHEQMSSGFDPHEHTAKISWQVLQAAIYEIVNYK
ncbi:MAG: hypothetical protein ACPGO5_03280 [Patescibacteria group bacterium]